MSRTARIAYWLAPIAFCIAIYWLGIRIWFAQDDFAWLNLRNEVTGFRSLLDALFAPRAQGTIRPLSERGFFLLFSYFFGMRALPYRVFVFLNEFLNIVLVMLVTRKLTRSDIAAFAAPLLWIVNVGLIEPMSWTSVYNEIQCATFLLAAFYMFLLYIETGERRYYWAQFAIFVVGFGSLEIEVVYPAIAALYAVLFARRFLRSTIPMFAVSAAYAIIDRLIAAQDGGYYYQMSWRTGTLLWSFGQYWKLLLGIAPYGGMKGWSAARIDTVMVLLTAALLAFVAWQTWKRRYLPLFFIGWFVIVLGPLLPLYHHVTDYYLAIPSIAIAMLAAYGLSLAWRRGWMTAAPVCALLLLYAMPSAIFAKKAMVYHFERADQARALVQSVAYAKRIHPGKMVLLDNVDDDLFRSAIYDSAFQPLGWNDIFLLPECRAQIHPDSHSESVDRYFLPASAVAEAVKQDAAVVYSVDGRKLRNITASYRDELNSRPAPRLASDIDVGFPFFSSQVGDGWYPLENGYRWCGRRAMVYLPGPDHPGEKLYISGTDPDAQRARGPIHLSLTIDGKPQPVQTIDGREPNFTLCYDVPREFVGRQKMEAAFTLDRTVRVGSDRRDLGLVFGRFTVK